MVKWPPTRVWKGHFESPGNGKLPRISTPPFRPPPQTKPIRLTISTPTTFKVQLRRGVFAFKTWTGREEEDSATTTWICLRGFFYGFYHMLNHHCYTVTFGRICSFFWFQASYYANLKQQQEQQSQQQEQVLVFFCGKIVETTTNVSMWMVDGRKTWCNTSF